MKSIVLAAIAALSLSACNLAYPIPVIGTDQHDLDRRDMQMKKNTFQGQDEWHQRNRHTTEVIWAMKQGLSDAHVEYAFDEGKMEFKGVTSTISKYPGIYIDAKAHGQMSEYRIDVKATGSSSQEDVDRVVEIVRDGFDSYMVDTY